uniref:NADH dehydrogenase subunit 6 n=1 Tax=Helota thoracica TaxID=3031831 RepID=UPI0023F10786|nr:NADH dehydrogenase subunit 6 [Helota thoracica]WEA76637.1 NADH dehydrogenase subunit 6 [Helota thoracica]
MFLMIMTILIMSLVFLFLNHPLSFGLVLLIESILISLSTGLMYYNFWFSYILFLIMVGGMLILFIYMTSIASNEKFKFSMKILLFIMVSLMIILMINLMLDQLFSYYMKMMNQNSFFINNFSMSKFINFPNNMILFTIINYLLLTLVAVVKISKIEYGPLRQMF